MDRDDFVRAGNRPGGNGTGPGTGFPLRRGPRAGPRPVRGPPAHLRSIELNVEGRWSADHGDRGLHYCGGSRTYVHFVNPGNTDLITLFEIVQTYLAAKENPETQKYVWYEAYGEELPDSLHPITRDTHIRRMWVNAAAHHQRVVRLYFQDEDCVIDEDMEGVRRIAYLIPRAVPLPRGFDYTAMNVAARDRRRQARRFGGAAVQGLQEMYGFQWYINDDPIPRAPVVVNVDLRAREGRQLSNIRLGMP